ncbi:MAG: four-carbon acid sugar kinase family protein [Gluconacetobacter diazotrophicus]|nr:four-carbon acid sugar kinase family protein [Gluconacetobacter diazotrophicus]
MTAPIRPDPIRLGCIADDYTGASDLASTLVREGLRTVQTVGVPDPALPLPEVDAVVVALKSRSIEPAEAVRLSLDAERWLRGRGAGHVMFKVCSTFDSTDRGNIGPVLDALRERAGAAGCVPVNPGFPETGRTVYSGHLFVGDVPLHESPLRDHPLNPMRDPDLRRVLARQSRGRVGAVPLSVMEEGAAAIRARLDALAADGIAAAIVDGVASRHFAALGDAAAALPLSVGASGLGFGLARALRGERRVDAGAERFGTGPGRSAILAGSCSAATLRQIAALPADVPRLMLDVAALLGGAPEAQRALDWARGHRNTPVLIGTSDAPEAVRAAQREHGAERTGRMVEETLAAIAAGLVADGVSRLVVAGGETSGAVVNRLELPGFAVGPAIAPGVPVLRAIGGDGGGGDLLLALKSGNFGGDDFFSEALVLMNGP